MATKKTNTLTVTAFPQHVTTDAGRFMPRASFEQLKFWGQLKEREQEVVIGEAKQLTAALMVHGASGLAIGEHLANIQKVLKPYEGAFVRLLRNFRFTERTAYRYIIAYNHAAASLPEPVLKAAMARGMNILGYKASEPLGKYTAAYEILKPLPAHPDPAQANDILDKLEKTRREINADPEKKEAMKKRLEKKNKDIVEEIRSDPDFLLMHSFRTVKNSLQKVSSRKREDFVDNLVGMLLSLRGVGNSRSFKPVAIPEKFNQGRGRPSNSETETSGAAAAS